MVGQVRAGRVEDRVIVAAAQFQRHLAGDRSCDPALGRLAQHQALRVEPAALVQQLAQAAAVAAVLLDRVFVVDAGDQALVGDVQQRHARGLVDAAALGLDDAVLDLVTHAQAVASADAVGFVKQRDRVREGPAVQCHRPAFLEAHGHGLGLDGDVLAPECDAHDRVDDVHAGVQELQVLGLVRRAQHVAVGRIGFLDAHLVIETGLDEVFAHLLASTQLIDEQLVQPGLVDPQTRVGEQPVAVETLDVVALVGAAITPDVDAVVAHRDDQCGAGDGSAQGRCVEVGRAARADVERAALDRRDALGHQGAAAVDQASDVCAVCQRLARDFVVVGFVGLAEVGGVGAGDRAFGAHPVNGRTRVKAARERDAHTLAGGKLLKYVGAHGRISLSEIGSAAILGGGHRLRPRARHRLGCGHRMGGRRVRSSRASFPGFHMAPSNRNSACLRSRPPA